MSRSAYKARPSITLVAMLVAGCTSAPSGSTITSPGSGIATSSTPASLMPASANPTPQPTTALPPVALIAMDVSYDANGNAAVIAVVDTDGTGYRELTTIADGVTSDPAWAGAGAPTLFYDKSDGASANHIFSMAVGGGPPKQWTSGAFHDFDPAISPDGRSMAFDRAAGGSNGGSASIFVLDLESGRLKRATTPPAGAIDGDLYPDWSPDGTKLVYEEDGSIVVADLKQGTTRIVLTPSQPAHRPKWSPDGRFILFGTTNIDSGPHQIHLVGVDGQGDRTLTDPAVYAVHPCWSPDGDFIAYIVRNPAARDLELRIMTAAGGSTTVVWHSPPGSDVYPGHPSWGPAASGG
jgi:Tol biopolymer transport system component